MGRSMGVFKRRAAVPREASGISDSVSKADLLEVAWHLASLCNEAGSADDNDSTRLRLIAELNVQREGRGVAPLRLATRDAQKGPAK